MDLVTDNRKDALLTVWDYNPDGSLGGFSETFGWQKNGSYKHFSGSRGGRYVKTFPPIRNPVTIGTITQSSPKMRITTGNHPSWGKRAWDGELAAVVADRCGVPSLSKHGMDYQLRDLALQKSYGNIDMSARNSQVFLAELAETVSMLVNPFRGIERIARKFPKRQKLWRELMAIPNATADTYLQYMFGVQPLIEDIKGVIDAYERAYRKGNEFYAKGTSRSMDSYNVLKTIYPTDLKCDEILASISGKAKVVTSARWYYRAEGRTDTMDMISKYGLNPLDIPVTAWMVFPLSFVVDWFFSVGAWIKTLRPLPGIDVLGNTVSEKLVETYEVNVLKMVKNVSTYPATTFVMHPMSKWVMSNERLIREVDIRLPSTPLQRGGIDSLGKAISSAALAFQRLNF